MNDTTWPPEIRDAYDSGAAVRWIEAERRWVVEDDPHPSPVATLDAFEDPPRPARRRLSATADEVAQHRHDRPSCNGRLLVDAQDDEAACLACGWRPTREAPLDDNTLPDGSPRQRRRAPTHGGQKL